MTPQAKYKLDLGFATIELHKNYCVGIINEGVLFNSFHLLKFHDIFNKHYSSRPFGYISNRKFDYAIDPTTYFELSAYSNRLVGIAALCYSKTSYDNAIFGKNFIRRPYDVFYTHEECVNWINGLIADY